MSEGLQELDTRTPLPPDEILDDSWHDYRSIVCTHCGHVIKVPVYCGDRFCHVCSRPRLNRVRNRINWLVKNTERKYNYGFSHLTLTIPSQPFLPGMLRLLSRSFRKLRQRKLWRSRVDGGAFVFEVTVSEAGFHAHIHAILFSRYIDFNDLLPMWLKCSGGRGVFIKRIPVGQIAQYLSKYISKPSGTFETDRSVSEALSGTRLFNVFGSWHSLNKLYTPAPSPCSNCGKSSWMPSDIFYSSLKTTSLSCNSP